MASSRAMLAIGLLAALLSPAFSTPTFISMPTDTSPYSTDFYANTCPELPSVVLSAVQDEFDSNRAIVAGLLRIFFNDCYPQGCDASLLLKGPNSEQLMAPNQRLQRRALMLIEEIRHKAHQRCGGPVVSCADIIALATRDAIVLSGGPNHGYDVPLGHKDSLAPAPKSAVYEIPKPTFNVSELLAAYETRNLDELDLVALSGRHTVGKAHCDSFKDRFISPRADAEFVRQLRDNCTKDNNRLQDLDVTTPELFDHEYFNNLLQGRGVLTSDQTLTTGTRTLELVTGFAENRWWFANQFGTSVKKLLEMKPEPFIGEIRRNCFRTNGPAAGSDDGFIGSSD